MPYWVLGRNANWFHVDPLVIRTRTVTVGVPLFGAEVDMHLNKLIYTRSGLEQGAEAEKAVRARLF